MTHENIAHPLSKISWGLSNSTFEKGRRSSDHMALRRDPQNMGGHASDLPLHFLILEVVSVPRGIGNQNDPFY